ncbi:MAG: cold shock domain-containing protein [Chloroflexi bacterium]|nr:cold shock domain-containing protein [Chloroflexota bacterium]
MSTGSIRRIAREYGFGFIKNDGGYNLFFHRSQVQDMDFALLRKGQRVKFRVDLTHKGLQAIDVKVIDRELVHCAQ